MRRIKSSVYTAVIVPDNFFKALALVKDGRGNTHGCLLGWLIGKIYSKRYLTYSNCTTVMELNGSFVFYFSDDQTFPSVVTNKV